MIDPYAAGALLARPCRCEDRGNAKPFGDLRDATCLRCGRQVGGKPLPSSRAKGLGYSLGTGGDGSTYAKQTRKFRPAQ